VVNTPKSYEGIREQISLIAIVEAQFFDDCMVLSFLDPNHGGSYEFPDALRIPLKNQTATEVQKYLQEGLEGYFEGYYKKLRNRASSLIQNFIGIDKPFGALEGRIHLSNKFYRVQFEFGSDPLFPFLPWTELSHLEKI